MSYDKTRQIRGRRFALLLIGAFPLLAEVEEAQLHQIPSSATNNYTVQDGPSPPEGGIHVGNTVADSTLLEQQAENGGGQHALMEEGLGESPSTDAAEALHDDGLQALPGLPTAMGRIENNVIQVGLDAYHLGTLSVGLSDAETVESGAGTEELRLGKNDSDSNCDDSARLAPNDSGDLHGKEAASTGSGSEDDKHLRPNGEPGKETEERGATTTVASEGDPSTSNEGTSTAQTADGKEVREQKVVSDENQRTVDKGKGGEMFEEDLPNLERVVVDYASKSAGALILEKSPTMKGTSNLLNNDKDKYAIAPCEDKKFVVIGLSEDILVKQVKLANYERYSSHVRVFQIFGSQTMGNWVDLGQYEATSSGNGEQTFDLKEPSWARYLKFRFLSHYGHEHYCTISQIKVHGSTMLQGFHEQWNEEEEKEAAAAAAIDATQQQQNQDDSQATVKEEEKYTSKTDPEQLEKEQFQENKEIDESPPLSTEAKPGSSSASETTIETKRHSNDKQTMQKQNKASESNAWENDPLPSAPDADRERVQLPGTKLLNGIKEKLAELLPTDDGKTLPSRTEESTEKSDTDPNELNDAEAEGSRVDYESSQVLESASIITASAEKATETSSKMEELDTSSLSMASAVKAALVDASDAILPSMNHAVEELQRKLATMIKLDELGNNLQEQMVGAGGDWAEGSTWDLLLTNDNGVPVSDEKESEGDALQERFNDNITSSHPPQHQADDVDTNSAATIVNLPNEAATESTKDRNTDAFSQMKPVSGYDPSLSSVTLGLPQEVLNRFPSSSCLSELDFAEFKAKALAARAAASSGQQGGGSATGKMEPIFKTLTEEIKALKTSHSIQDQFSKATVVCYQQIVVEMVKDLDGMRNAQDQRVARLEAEMRKMQSRTLWGISQWFLRLIRHFAHMAAELMLEVYVIVENELFRILKHEVVANLVLRLMSAEKESLILAGTTAIATLLIWFLLTGVANLLFGRRGEKKAGPSDESVNNLVIANAEVVRPYAPRHHTSHPENVAYDEDRIDTDVVRGVSSAVTNSSLTTSITPSPSSSSMAPSRRTLAALANQATVGVAATSSPERPEPTTSIQESIGNSSTTTVSRRKRRHNNRAHLVPAE